MSLRYLLFIVYSVSYFCGLTFRFPVLGAISFDFIIGGILLGYVARSMLFSQSNDPAGYKNTARLLVVLVLYTIITLPFTQWPGTVLNQGLPKFLKLIVFYFYAVTFIRNEEQLKQYVNIYVILMLFVILEPVAIYVTQGRLGYVDYSMGEDIFKRLSGTTRNVGGNPNGLANLIAMTLPFPFFYYGYYKSKVLRALILGSVPLLFYALVLTGSRSGLIAALVATIVSAVKTKNKKIAVVIAILILSVGALEISGMYKERYRSIVSKDAAGREGAVERLENIQKGLLLAIDRPVFGYGLGTYGEANWNILRIHLVSHNMYVGVLVELGVLGSVVYGMFIASIFKNLKKAKTLGAKAPQSTNYLMVATDIFQVVLITELVFSFFGSGLWHYVWYLIGGLSSALLRIVTVNAGAPEMLSGEKPLSAGGAPQVL